MFSKIKNIKQLINEPLKNYSSFKIGGNAKYLIMANTADSLIEVIYTCKQHSLPFKIIGNGSNMLFDDLGYNGAIIKYSNDYIKLKNNCLQVSSGCSINELITFTHQHNLCGFEFAVGVPAQVGGAVANNLGAYQEEFSTYISQVTILKNGHLSYLKKHDCNFDYHCSRFQKGDEIVLGITFQPPKQDKAISQQKMFDFFNQRKSKQPLNLPNAGSIFKRLDNLSPAKLIDDANLKGTTIGDAQISTKHAGFIVNIGNAKSNDVLNLINLIKIKIFEKYNIDLQLEIEHLPYL